MNERKDGGRQKQRRVSSYDDFVLMLDVQTTLLLELAFLDEIFFGCQGVFLVVSFLLFACSVVVYYIFFESDDAFAMRRKL